MTLNKWINCALFLALSVLLTACQGKMKFPPMERGFEWVQMASNQSCSAKPTPGCSVFTVSKGDQVFFGGNDDYINPDSYYWADSGQGKGYGAVWIGTPDNVQQGVNEKGLAYDANGLPRVDTNPHPERQSVIGGYSSYPIRILRECATVEEVIEWVNTHQWHSYMHDQMHFADASGDAVVISAGEDGELVFSRKPAGDGFLVSTNFNVANPSNGYYPCERYETATKQLSRLVEGNQALTVEDAVAVLEAVSVDGGSSWTLESLVADLPRGVVYLYYFRQFDKPVVLNVANEIAHPRPPGALSKLFPEDVRREAASRYQQALSRQGLCGQIGKIWTSLVLISVIIVSAFSIRYPKGLLYWLPVTLILGPLALLVWLVAGRKQAARPWQVAMIEAAGHLPATAVAFMVMLSVFIIKPQAQANQMVLALFVFILPLLLGWLFYQGPLLAIVSHRGYLRTLAQRLPVTWIAANLGMGCMTAVTVPLVAWISLNCSAMEMSIWMLVSVWVVVVAGAYVGFVFIWLYESWARRYDWRAWSVLVTGEGEISTPSWRKLWWWVLLSFVVMIGGAIINNLVN